MISFSSLFHYHAFWRFSIVNVYIGQKHYVRSVVSSLPEKVQKNSKGESKFKKKDWKCQDVHPRAYSEVPSIPEPKDLVEYFGKVIKIRERETYERTIGLNALLRHKTCGSLVLI